MLNRKRFRGGNANPMLDHETGELRAINQCNLLVLQTHREIARLA